MITSSYQAVSLAHVLDLARTEIRARKPASAVVIRPVDFAIALSDDGVEEFVEDASDLAAELAGNLDGAIVVSQPEWQLHEPGDMLAEDIVILRSGEVLTRSGTRFFRINISELPPLGYRGGLVPDHVAENIVQGRSDV